MEHLLLSLLSRFIKLEVLQLATEKGVKVHEIPFEDENNRLPVKDVVIGVATEGYVEQQLNPPEPSTLKDMEEQPILMESNVQQFGQNCKQFLVTVAVEAKACLPFQNKLLNRLTAEFFPVEVTLSLWIP